MFSSTFAIGTTAVVDGGEDDDDVIEDSNVVGECVRSRLQFRFNSVVIVSFESTEEIGEILMREKETRYYWEIEKKKRRRTRKE